jgi:serine/threonine-protein kinase
MKHISAIPEPPSTLRPEVPDDLDKVVLRALGKTPPERYPSAEEMDKDLQRVADGVAVSRETDEAATMILSGAHLAPPTIVAPPRPPAEVLYEYDEPRRGRPVWPWLLVLLLLVAAGLTGWFVYQQVKDELGEAGAVGVPYLIDLRETQAVGLVIEAGLKPNVIREFRDDAEEGFVYEQSPDFGQKVDAGTTVDVFVSKGPPQTTVPEVVGESRDDAVAALARADLEPRIVEVFSEEEPGTVVGQDPAAGKRVETGTRVRINVSRGARPLVVPPVVGEPYETAASTLDAAGFNVQRRNVESTEPEGTVVGQNPAANTEAAPGATVTLNVSKGPQMATVPDVTTQDEATARATLETAGFQVEVQNEETTDPAADGFVTRQEPPGGTEAPAGSTVTIVVARFAG